MKNTKLTPWTRFVGSVTALVLIPFGTMPRVFAADQTWTGTTDQLWSTSTNWTTATPGSGDDVIFPLIIPSGGSTITLGAGSLANALSFKNAYRLSGGDLTLTSGGVRLDMGVVASVDSILAGTAGLTLTGGGSLRLAAGNTYTGTTTINNGALIVSNASALGADTSTIVVNGSPTRGAGGGALVLEGGYSSGVTLSRGLSLSGLGPISDRSAALNSVGTNTVLGAVSSSVGTSLPNTRIVSSSGLLTLSGGLDVAGTAATTLTLLGGGGGTNSSAGAGSYAITGVVTGTGTLEKNGAGTLFLTPSSMSGFSGTLRMSANATGTQSSVRLTAPIVLGTRTSTTGGSVIDMNGGILEVMMDAPSVQSGATPANANVYQRNNSTFYVDHALGSTVTGGTLTLGQWAFEENFNATFNVRNGYNVTIGAAPVQGGNANSTFTNNLAGGTLTFTGAFWSNSESTADRTMTIAGNGNTTITGNVTASTAAAGIDHNLTKTGTGTLQITSTGSTLDGNVNIQGGTVQITDFRSITNNTANVNIGTTTTTGTLQIGTATTPSAAGLTTSKVLNLNGTTGGAVINASQPGTNPVIVNSNITQTGLGSKTLTLGGTSPVDNIINGVISDNATTGSTSTTANMGAGTTSITLASVDGVIVGAAVTGSNIAAGTTVATVNAGTKVITLSQAATNTGTVNAPVTIGVAGLVNLTGLTKTDAGIWALSGSNTYTGATTLLQGTLKLKPTAGAATVIADTSTISLGATGNLQNSGGTLELVGVSNTATTESLGALTPVTGASTIKLTGTGTGSSSITFASLGTVAAGTGVNFNTSAAGTGGAVTLTGAAGFVNPHLTINGSDFAFADGAAVLRAPIYGTDAGSNTTAAGPLAATSYNEVTGSVAGINNITINGLKISGANTLTLNATQTLTVRTGAAGTSGAILATGGNSTITGGTGITTGGAGDLVINVNSGSQLTVATVLTSGTTGGLTKNGAGTLILSAVNAQTGVTNINEGTVQLSGTGKLSANNATTNIRTGATLDLNGVGTGSAIGQFNGGGIVTNTNATAATLTVGNNNGTGTFSGIIQNGTGVVNVTKAGTGGQTWSGASTYTGVTSIASTGVVTLPIIANIGTASGIGRGDNTSSATNAASLVFTGTTGGISYSGNTTANTDRLFTFNGSAASSGARIENNSATNAPLSFTNTGALVYGASATVAQTLTLGGTSTADSVFAPQINDNGANRTALIKNGAGTWVLSGSNTYTGITTIGTGTTASGVLQAIDGVGLPTNSPLLLAAGTTGGGQFQSSGNFTRNVVATPAAGTGTITLGATTSTSAAIGFSASGGKLVVALGGLATPTALTWGSGGFMGVTGTSTGALLLNNPTSTSEVEIRNAINLNGATRTISVDDNGNTGADFATITGVVSGSGSLTKSGTGILQLFGANTYTGNTAVTAGTLTVTSLGNSTSAGASSVGDSTVGNTTSGSVNLGNASTTAGVLEYVGTGETSDRMIRLNTTTATNQIHASGSGALILTNVDNTMTNGVKTLALRGSSTAGNTISGVLTNANTGADALSVLVDGGATWILSGANTYTGNTTVSAGALGLGNDAAVGSGTLVLSNGSIFASGGDRTIANSVTLSNNTTPAFVGDYSITFAGAFNNAASANNTAITNNIVAGKALTLGTVANTAITATRALTINGTGDTIITGGITTTANFNLNLAYSGTGSLTLGGVSDINGGSMTFSSGTLKVGDDEAIPHGAAANTLTTAASSASTTVTVSSTAGLVPGQVFTGGTGGATVVSIDSPTTFTASAAQTLAAGAQLLFDPKGGNVTFNPATGVTATLDLNGKSETINGFTATTAGTTIIDNTSATAASLTLGANDQAVSIGGGGGVYQIQNSGGALSLAKTGKGTANIAASLTYTGATTVSNGTLNLNGSIASPTLNVSATGTLKLIQGVTTPDNLTSVTVAAASGAAFTGGTLSFANGVGTPFNNLTTLNLGAGTGTAYLELDAGDTGTDTLTLLNPNVAVTANSINFLIKDIDLSNTTTYNLLVAPGGGLSGGTYSFSLAGYTGGSLSVSDTAVSLTTGTLITSDVYWNGGAASTAWNTVVTGTPDLTNFSSDSAGLLTEATLPGKGQKVYFVADNITGGAALSTTLEQSFKINALEFRPSTVSADTPRSVTIAPGAVSSNQLNVSPSANTDGINLAANASPLVTISAPVVAGASQTWNTADAVNLSTGATTASSAVVTVASTTGLRPGMTITGTNIPAGTTILSVDSASQVTLSANATATATSQSLYAAQQLNVSGALTGTGNINKTGAGKVVLSTAATGYSGTYTASGGVTELTNVNALSGVAATPGAGAPVSIGSGGIFYYNNATTGTISNNITLNGGTLSAGGNTQNYSGSVNVAASSTILMRDSANATTSASGRSITLVGPLSGTAAITLDSVDTASAGNQVNNTLTINNAASTWSGPLNLTRGTALFTNVAGGGNVTPYVGYDGIINFNQFGRVIYRNIDGGSLTRTAALNYAASAVGELNVDNLGALASNYTVTQSGAVNLNSGSIVRLFLSDVASNLELTGGVVLNGNASISVAGGDADSLVSINSTGISGSGNLAINDEAGTWGTTSTRLAINAASTFVGNTTLNEGTLILGHKDALSTGSLTITGASTIQAGADLSGVNAVANALNLNNNLTVSGSNNLTLSGAVAATGADANRTLTNSLTAGTLELSGTFNLGAAGNTAARTLTLSGAGNTSVGSAVVNGSAFANALLKNGTGTLSFGTGNTYTGATSLDQGTLAYTATNVQTGVFNFGSANTIATTGTLDLSAASATFGSLVAQTDTATANNLTIGAGQTLTITGNVTLGTARAASTNTALTATGGGSLVVQNVATPPTSFVVGGATSAASQGNKAVVDLSGLSNLTVELNTTSGVFRVNPANANNVSDKYSVLTLPSTGAGTTTITTNSLNVGDSAQNSASAGQINQLKLGTGVNTLNANTVNIGTGGRDIGSITFNTASGSVVLRAADGTSRAAFNIATGAANTGVAAAGPNTFDVSGHNADLLISTLTIGGQNRNTDRTDNFTFDTGTLDATTVVIGTNNSAANATAASNTWTSNLNLSGGSTVIGTGGLDISRGATAVSGADTLVGNLNISGTASVTVANNATFGAAIRMSNNTIASGLTANSNINLTGGSLTVAGHILKGASTGAGTATVTLNGGTLDMGGFNVGASTAAVSLAAQSGTLSNLAELNGGGTLTKTTAGVLSMSGTNTYSGLTDIQAGELKAVSVGGFSGNSTVNVSPSTFLTLNGFSNSVGGLSGSGTVQNASATAASLILGANNGSPSVSGVLIEDGTGGGALTLVKQGTGTTTISGSHTFTGKTIIENGVVSVGSVDAATTAQPLGVNSSLDLGVAATSSGTLLYTGAAATLGKNINALGNGSDTIQNAGTGLLTLSGTLTKDGTTLNLNGGASGILVTGTIVGASASSDLVIAGGVVTLGNTNTYNGPTILNAGTLNINNAGAISSGTFIINGGTIDNTSGSAITLAGNNPLTINADFTFGGSNDLNLGTGAVTLNANRTVTLNAGTLTIGGSIAGAFNLTGTGAGTLLLTGASTYTGTTNVQGGSTFNVGGNGALGDTSSGTVVGSGSALVLNNVNYTDAEPLNITGTGTGGAGALVGGGTSSFAGPITLGGNATIGSGGGTFSLGGNIDKTGTVLTLAGGGTFNINGSIVGNTGSPNSDLVVDATTVNLNSANTYNGPTYIQNVGVLNANVANALPTANGRTAIIMNNTAGNVLNLGASQSIASLTGGANDAVTLGYTLTIGAASGATIYGGSISGSGAIVKDLASTLTLDQAASYTGGTTVNGGTLNVRNTSGSATGTGGVTVGASGTLSGTGSIAPDANASIYINGSFVVGDSTAGSPVASTFGLSTSGAGSTVMGAGSSMSFDLFSNVGDNSAIASAADYVNLTGSLDLTAASTLILTNPNNLTTFALGDKWKLLSFTTGSIVGVFTSINDSALNLATGLYGSFTTDAGGGYYVITNVPEPTRALLLMLGLLGIGMRRRRTVA